MDCRVPYDRSIGLKATSLKRTEESNESQHQVAGLCEGHSCNRLAGSVGRPDKAAIRMLKNQVPLSREA
uniref:Uncharacterized protein n=1 Tax=Oryza glumipatula TaxID=40148 RepID=A0A0D9Y4Y9_9ORYZ